MPNNVISKKFEKGHSFKLNYAPHIGMFKHSAGNDLIDQINYMADLGFTAFEDNGMKSRSIDTQEKISKTLDERKMKMGVFVAHKIYWKEPNLASGDKKYREEFLNNIKESVDVAKRVNAKWMTVVPGHLDLRKETFNYKSGFIIFNINVYCIIFKELKIKINLRDNLIVIHITKV